MKTSTDMIENQIINGGEGNFVAVKLYYKTTG